MKINSTSLHLFLTAKVNIAKRLAASVGIGPRIEFPSVSTANLRNFSENSGKTADGIVTVPAGMFSIGYMLTRKNRN
jgi:hypothetical protein